MIATCPFPTSADITGKRRRNRAGILLSTVDTEEPLYDSTFAGRERAMISQQHP